jgi:hypothetical protein
MESAKQGTIKDLEFDWEAEIKRRDDEIRDLWRTGTNSNGQLAGHYGLTTQKISTICKGVKRRNMEKECPVCHRVFTAAFINQVLCTREECRTVWDKALESKRRKKKRSQLKLEIETKSGQQFLDLTSNSRVRR